MLVEVMSVLLVTIYAASNGKLAFCTNYFEDPAIFSGPARPGMSSADARASVQMSIVSFDRQNLRYVCLALVRKGS